MALKVLVVISLFLTGLSTTSIAETNSSQVQCAPYIFLGMSGSGQKSDERETGLVRELGPELASLYSALSNSPEFKDKLIYDPITAYEAVGIPGYSKNLWEDISKFLAGLKSNSTESLLTRFLEYTKSCPESRFVIAGYSQGAFAAHYLVTQMEKAKAEQIQKVLGVILLANPANPKQGIVPFFDAETQKSKVLKGASTAWWTGFCTTLKVTKYYQSCIDVAGEQIANLQIKESLPEPKVMKVFSFYSKLDLVSDTKRVFSGSNLTLEILKVREGASSRSVVPSKSGIAGQVALGVTNATLKARNIHSSYCPANGEFAPKDRTKRERCINRSNSEFIQGSLKYLRKQLSAG